MTKKNLVLMIPQLANGGAERVVSRLSFMLKDFYNITIVVFDNSKITYKVGCEVICLGNEKNNSNSKFYNMLNFIKRIYLYNKYKKSNKVDITYSFGDTANFVNVFSFGTDKKIISIRGFRRIRTGENFKQKYILKPISKLICSKADTIVSVSKLMTQILFDEYKIPIKKIETSYNGYDIEKIISLSTENIDVEVANKIDKKRVVISAGTFRSEKGYWHLLKAFSLVSKKIDDVVLLILGEDHNGYKQKINQLAKELSIEDKIIYGGYQSNPFKYFSKSSIYVLSSTYEGFPNAMVEAMACKLPIIASDCKTGPREILAPYTDIYTSTENIEWAEYGVLVKKMNDVENFDSTIIEDCDQFLAEAIIKLLEDDEMRRYYASQSISRVFDFHYTNWIKQQREIIN